MAQSATAYVTIRYITDHDVAPVPVNTVNGDAIGALTKVYSSPSFDIWEQIYLPTGEATGGGAVLSVNGQTGAVVLTADNLNDGTTKGIVSLQAKGRLNDIVANGIAGAAATVSAAGAEIKAILDAHLGAGWENGGVVDHGALTGLGDDDHPQYLTEARGDLIYYRKTTIDAALAGKAAAVHTHGIDDVSNLQAALDAKAAASHTHPISEVTNLQTELDGKAAASHNHDAANITTGVLPPARTGTGQLDNAAQLHGDGVYRRTDWGNIANKPATFAPSNHTHSATALTSGVLPDGRVQASNVTQHTGAIQHNSLAGLTTDDPHTQYLLASAARPLAAPLVSPDPTLSGHLANKGYVDSAVSGITPLDPVLDRDLTTSPAHVSGARYIIAGTGGDWSAFDIGDIVQSNGVDTWTRTAPTNGMQTWIEDEGVNVRWTGNAWEVWPLPVDHNTLQNIGTKSHGEIDQHIIDGTIHFVINDAGTENGEVWSSFKVSAELATKAALGHSHDASDIGDGLFDRARLGNGEASSSTALFANEWRQPDWNDLTSRPETFAPSAHTHAIGDITNLQSSLDGKAPTVHVHDGASITTGLVPVARMGTGTPGATTALMGDGVWRQVPWTSLAGVPSTFPPSGHSHVQSEVAGLEAALISARPDILDEAGNVIVQNATSIRFAGPGATVSPDATSPGAALVTVAGDAAAIVPVVANPNYPAFTASGTIGGTVTATVTYNGQDVTEEFLDPNSFTLQKNTASTFGTVTMQPSGVWTFVKGSDITNLQPGESVTGSFDVFAKNKFGEPGPATTVQITASAVASSYTRAALTLKETVPAGFVLDVYPEMISTNGLAFLNAMQADAGDLRASLNTSGADDAAAGRMPLQIFKFKTHASGSRPIFSIRFPQEVLTGTNIYLWCGNDGTAKIQPPNHEPYGGYDVWTDRILVCDDFELDRSGNKTWTVDAAITLDQAGLADHEAAVFTGENGKNIEEAGVWPEDLTARTIFFTVLKNAGTGRYVMAETNAFPNESIYFNSDTVLRYTLPFSDGEAIWECAVPAVGVAQQWAITATGGGGAGDVKFYLNGVEQAVTNHTGRAGTLIAPRAGRVWGSHGNSNAVLDGWLSDIEAVPAVKDADFIALRAQLRSDPVSVAEVNSGGVTQAAPPSFSETEWFDPGPGYAGQADVLPGQGIVPTGGNGELLLQGGVAYSGYNLDGNAYPENLFFNRTSTWDVELTKSGSPNVYLKEDWLFKNGYLNEAQHWIKWPVVVPSEYASQGYALNKVRSRIMAYFNLPTNARDYNGGPDHPDTEYTNAIFRATWQGGNGDDIRWESNPADNTYNTREAIQRVPDPGGLSFMWFYASPTAAWDTIDWTTFRVERVTDAGGGNYTPVGDPAKRVSKMFRDGTAYCHILRFMDMIDSNEGELRSLHELSTDGDIGPFQHHRPGHSRMRYGHNLKHLLADTHAEGQVLWYNLPLQVGSPVRRRFTYQDLSGHVGTGDGAADIQGDLWYPGFRKNTFALSGTPTGIPEGATLTLTTDGRWSLKTGATPLAGQTYPVNFKFTCQDWAGNALPPMTMRFNIEYASWEADPNNQWFYIPPGGPSAQDASFYNADIINDDRWWFREAEKFVDILVASGYPNTKKLILEIGGNEIWNYGGTTFQQDYQYASNLALGLFGSGGVYGAMRALGWLGGRWMYAIRREFALRGLTPYNICYTASCQTADTNTTSNVIQGIKDYLISVSLDPADYIKPGHFEPALTTYTGGVFYARTTSPSGTTDDAANLQFWKDQVTAGTFATTAKNWLMEMGAGNGVDSNLRFIIDQWLAQEAVCAANGTRLLGAYEGGPHTELPPGIRDDPTAGDVIDAYYDFTYGQDGADVHAEAHKQLSLAFPGRQLVMANFVMSGARAPNGPWQEGSFWAQAGSPRLAMWKAIGRPGL